MDLGPRRTRRHVIGLARALRGGSALAMLTMMRRGRPAWCAWKGLTLLLRWSGERLPLPSIEPASRRPAEIVGLAQAAAEQVDEFAEVQHAASTIYHYALLAIAGGGVAGDIDPRGIVTRVYDAGGLALGALPNAPGATMAQLLPGNKVRLSWAFSSFNQQVEASFFEVYAAAGTTSINFAAPPEATVSRRDGQAFYEWISPALAAADERSYAVRSVSAAGVRSLIPQPGWCPSGSYTAVSRARCPWIIVPAGPPPATRPYLEVVE